MFFNLSIALVLTGFVVTQGFLHQQNFGNHVGIYGGLTHEIKRNNFNYAKHLKSSPRIGFQMMAEVTTITSGDSEEQKKKDSGLFSIFQEKNRKVAKKILPQTLMMFFILFNYTILRDTKDVLIVTAPKSGAEIIPFLKTYVQLPAAIVFTFIYSALCNRMSSNKVFYTVITPFLAFFGAFAAFIYPARDFLHPNLTADFLTTILPAVFLPLIAIFRNWTFAMFYMMAELWGSVVLSLLFWGFANDINTVEEAKAYYPLFGLVANVALIFSG